MREMRLFPLFLLCSEVTEFLFAAPMVESTLLGLTERR